MAIVYQSVQSASSTDASLTITKPTSLAVGDTLFAGIYFSDDRSGSGGINTPSGWTLLSTTNTGSPTHEVLAVFVKEADSSDVAASNFTFSRSGADTVYHMIGHLLRITDFGILAGSTTATDNSSTNTITATTFTPTRANTLFIAFLANATSSSPVGNTSVALATNDPAWTEQAETQVSDTSRNSTLSVYTATRTESTATGTITGTIAATVPFIHMHAYSLSSQIDGSINPTTYVNAYAYNPLNPSATLDANVEDPITATSGSPAQWTNTSKPTTTWTNTDKN